eukprot:Gregarina_sp_Poly_1__9120@NODE_55_length_17436_cov_154_331798_g47_i0_p10_GENE_NODE_55_length_17436_cov_154_331798_g47_i0NODE_55_length_17436_cov_154_331798_g47_i0_p10_ORF_typecomplete_len229_score41_79Peptidase_C12/PF01088_21/9_5e54Josephin/PF02099_17/0_26_NODE_55_length_17436_cov_154_331798_g47_i01062111307
MSSRWLPLESNPDVFQEYIRNLKGPADVQIVDLWAFQDWAIDLLPKPVLALIFVFPLTPGFRRRYNSELEAKIEKKCEGIWFTRQTIPNACGTIALLHILMNIRGQRNKFHFDVDGPLDKLRKGFENMNPTERAKAMERDTALETAHQAVEQKGVTTVSKEEVAEHYVALIQLGGKLYELDGRLEGPICHGESSEATFVTDAIAVMENMMTFDESTHNYSALAVCERN